MQKEYGSAVLVSAHDGILEFPCGVERLPNGNTLIADGGAEDRTGSEVIEVSPNGQIVWRYADNLLFAHSALRLPNGNTLITDTTNNRVIEVSHDGAVVFSTDEWSGGTGRLSDGTHLEYTNDAHAMADGTLFITDRNNNRCVQVDRSGTVLWQYSGDLRLPHNADPLPNGNVIIADSDRGRVIEVNRNGDVVWSYGDRDGHESLYWPRDADRLPNGNTLICDSRNSRLLEVDPNGDVVWRFGLPYFANLYDADLLPNGNVLVSDQQHQRVIEIDRFGNIVWQFRNYRSEYPIHPKLTNGFFKQRNEQGNPADWILYKRFSEGGGRIVWDQDERGRPVVGLEMERNGKKGVVCLMQVVSMQPGRRYRLGGMLRAEGIQEESFAALQVMFRDRYGGQTQDASLAPKGTPFTGSTEWINDSLEVEAPAEATAAEIRILLTGKGRVWVRQLMMM